MHILITDDHALFRQGLAILLAQLPETTQVHTADSGSAAIETINSTKIDLILMDIDMPQLSGIDTVKAIRQQQHQVPIIALSISARPYDILHMYEAGINGYLLKSSSIQEVRNALNHIQKGQEYYCPEIKDQLFELLTQHKPQQNELSAREKQVLIMICQQYSTEEIAQALYVSPLTINNHRRSILKKTNSKNVAGLVLYALEKHIYTK